jgi:hypothetical protein
MSVAFKRGSTTGPSDLAITVRDSLGQLIDPYNLKYAVYDATTSIDVLFGALNNTPVRASLGQYWAQVAIPADTNVGDWRIRWTIQESSTDPVYQSVQEFNVVGDNVITGFTGDLAVDKLIYRLRIMLGDNNPDRTYHFRPPASAKFIQGQTQVFGFVWEDEELLECIYIAINDANTRPPLTGFTLADIVTGGGAMGWSSLVLVRAAWFANMMQAQRWAVDSFDYSISGVSLNLSEKFTQYTALKDEYGAEFDKMVEQAKLTIKIVKGLRQQKYGIGISSALGPLSRPGVQSRANWISSSRPGSF